MKLIKFTEKEILNPANWTLYGEDTLYTGHSCFASPFESYDSCGNCNGANCDICKEVKRAPEFRFSINGGDLIDLIKSQLPLKEHDRAFDIYDYNDSEYEVEEFPDEDFLQDNYPEFVEQLWEREMKDNPEWASEQRAKL